MPGNSVQRQFASWLDGFLDRAGLQGIGASTLDQAKSRLSFIKEVSRKENAQAEFTLAFGSYVERSLPPGRISEGRQAYTRIGAALDQIAGRFKIDPAILLAIWGIESSYGARRGSFPVPGALATLASASRRPGFFEEELLSALRIVESGAVSIPDMTGSWAGAMGHTQFMPSSYLAHAVSLTGDGLPDIWSDDPLDSLASTANYLAEHGWSAGLPWGFEVTLSPDFNHEQSGLDNARPALDWTRDGVILPDSQNGIEITHSSILLPGGYRGPAFLVTRNFLVLKRYNNAVAYVIAVGLLADAIAGRTQSEPKWPSGSPPLSRSEILALQQMLVELGLDTGGTDGIIGPATSAAVRMFQKSAGLVPDGFADRALLDRLGRELERPGPEMA